VSGGQPYSHTTIIIRRTALTGRVAGDATEPAGKTSGDEQFPRLGFTLATISELLLQTLVRAEPDQGVRHLPHYRRGNTDIETADARDMDGAAKNSDRRRTAVAWNRRNGLHPTSRGSGQQAARGVVGWERVHFGQVERVCATCRH
jgi:hypothetical protein